MKSKTGAISGSTKWTLVQTKNLKKKKKKSNKLNVEQNLHATHSFGWESNFEKKTQKIFVSEFKWLNVRVLEYRTRQIKIHFNCRSHSGLTNSVNRMFVMT